MVIASVAASVLGAAIGARGGFWTAILGVALGVVAAGLSVFLINWAMMLLVRASGRDPRRLEYRLTTLATWSVASLATLAAVGAAIGLY